MSTALSLSQAYTDMRPDPRNKRAEPIPLVVLLALPLRDTALPVEISIMLAQKDIRYIYQLVKLSLEEFGRLTKDIDTYREVGEFLDRRCWIKGPLKFQQPLIDFLTDHVHRDYEVNERDARILNAAHHY